MLQTLSVIMITLNEEKNLRRALESVKFAEEIIINDSGSTDRTLEIAKEFNAKILHTEFSGFGKAKQIALAAAGGDWVLSVDADEELDSELQQSVRETIKKGDAAGYYLNRKSQFLGRWILHSGWYPDYILRLFRRELGNVSDDQVHESITVRGTTAKLAGHLLHYTDPDLEHYLEKMNRYTSLSVQSLQRQGRQFHLSDIIIKPPAAFVKMYLFKQGWRDGLQGLLLALCSAFHVLTKYAKLWELRKQ